MKSAATLSNLALMSAFIERWSTSCSLSCFFILFLMSSSYNWSCHNLLFDVISYSKVYFPLPIIELIIFSIESCKQIGMLFHDRGASDKRGCCWDITFRALRISNLSGSWIEIDELDFFIFFLVSIYLPKTQGCIYF